MSWTNLLHPALMEHCSPKYQHSHRFARCSRDPAGHNGLIRYDLRSHLACSRRKDMESYPSTYNDQKCWPQWDSSSLFCWVKFSEIHGFLQPATGSSFIMWSLAQFSTLRQVPVVVLAFSAFLHIHLFFIHFLSSPQARQSITHPVTKDDKD